MIGWPRRKCARYGGVDALIGNVDRHAVHMNAPGWNGRQRRSVDFEGHDRVVGGVRERAPDVCSDDDVVAVDDVLDRNDLGEGFRRDTDVSDVRASAPNSSRCGISMVGAVRRAAARRDGTKGSVLGREKRDAADAESAAWPASGSASDHPPRRGQYMGKRAVSRRDFLRISGGAGAGLFFVGQVAGQLFEIPVAAAPIPGGTLDPAAVAKYETPLLIPPVMPRAGTITMPGGKRVDYYEISVRQFAQQVLPAPLPTTTVWGYGADRSAEQQGRAAPQCPVVDDRGPARPAGAGQVDQRPGRRRRQLPAPPAAGRSDAALGQPARRHDRA